jgi:hypothetical protein
VGGQGRLRFGEAKDGFDVRAEFGAALQEVGQDLSSVSIAQAPGRRRIIFFVIGGGGGGGRRSGLERLGRRRAGVACRSTVAMAAII